MPPVHVIANALRRLGANIMGVGLLALALACVVNPHEAAVMYGLPVQEDTRWVVIAGIRDAGLGIITCVHEILTRIPRPSKP